MLGGEWFSDNLPDVAAGKDVATPERQMVDRDRRDARDVEGRGRAAQGVHHTDHGTLPPHYGRKEVIEPRQCVFIGTTNRDATFETRPAAGASGPCKVGRIDIEALSVDRDQLFAEAVAAFHGGRSPGGPIVNSRSRIAPQQASDTSSTSGRKRSPRYLVEHPRVTVGEIAKEALNIATAKIGTAEQRRIAAALERLGWRREQPDWQGKRWWSRQV